MKIEAGFIKINRLGGENIDKKWDACMCINIHQLKTMGIYKPKTEC